MEETRHLYADPSTSPFVRYGGGYAVFPPNGVRSAIATTLDALSDGASRQEASKRFVKRAWIGGQPEIHPASTWHAVFLSFVAFYERHFEATPQIGRMALDATRLMLSGDIEIAWEALRDFLLGRIDDMSGWNASWVRDDAEQRGIVRREDGTYWYPDASGTLIQILGAKILPETRLDFISDSILRPWGALHQVLMLFALVATSEDFRQDPSAYPTSLRLAVFPESVGVAFRWQIRYRPEIRTVKWRPLSNLCDPEWLAQFLAAKVVDATSRDIWSERPSPRPHSSSYSCGPPAW
jgi:hypothetical protein